MVRAECYDSIFDEHADSALGLGFVRRRAGGFVGGIVQIGANLTLPLHAVDAEPGRGAGPSFLRPPALSPQPGAPPTRSPAARGAARSVDRAPGYPSG